ncbi:MAG: non-canonical purine NTP pyrophosphatase [Parcubacteria group bacterium]
MKNPTIFFMTSAPYKFAAAAKVLGDSFNLIQINIEVPEHQSAIFNEVAVSKAIAAFEQVRCPVIVDDAGIMIEAYNGWPGALAKYAKRDLTMRGILRLMNGIDNRRAVSVTDIAYCDTDFYSKRRPIVFEAKQSGLIADLLPDTPLKENAGFDYIFIPEGATKPFVHLSSEELEKFSERYAALRKFSDWARIAILKKTKV